MLLPTQIQAILYHFLMGWVYAFGFSFLISFVSDFKRNRRDPVSYSVYIPYVYWIV